MPKIVNKPFPEGDSCPVCGRKLKVLHWDNVYKEAICNIQKGNCGWSGYARK